MSVRSTGRRALIVTGEASGDLHGANLIRAAQQVDPDLSFFGVGGPRMAQAGCEILIPGEELAVMGLVEVVGHLTVILKALNRLGELLEGEVRPDVLILIDFPDFNLRLAKRAKRAGVPVLYYVSPQVWAWRRGRVKKIAAVVDRLAAIFPFEPDYYAGLDIEARYVGNPLLDEARVMTTREELLGRFRIDPRATVVGLFPGSRHNELRYNLETILASAKELLRQRPGTQFILPVAPTLRRDDFAAAIAASGVAVTLVEESIYDVAAACEAVICVSGTVTLQTALVGTPMAIVYRMAPLTYAIGKRLVKVPAIGLANIVAGQKVVQEFIQEAATPAAIAGEIGRILDDAPYRERMRAALATIQEKMGEPGCSERVARMASEMSRGERRSKDV